MGLTLVAILTAALLLPGIVAARAFYLAGNTREIDVPVPALSTPEGIALVGTFSVAVHTLYVILLWSAATLPALVPLPAANPYLLFTETSGLSALDAAWALFSGLLLLSLTAACTGWLAGKSLMLRGNRAHVFYGPLADVIRSAEGDDKFITAYVVTKIAEGKRLVGYEGTVDSLHRDAERYPAKVVLRDVVPFYLELTEEAPRRIETNQLIDWLVVSSEDWHNIAFRVFQFVDEDDEDGEVPLRSAT